MDKSHRAWVRYLTARGIPRGHVAFVLGIDEDLVERDLALDRAPKTHGGRYPKRRPCPPGLKSVDCHSRRILSHTATKIRRFAKLGYKPTAIANILILAAVVVANLLVRLTPIRLCHRQRDRAHGPASPARTWPRSEREPAPRARRLSRLELTPAAGWTNADRLGTAAAELAEYARFLAAVREGKLASRELLDHAGLFYAVPRRPAVDAPAIWTGSDVLHVVGPLAMTVDEIHQAGELLRAGATYVEVARRFNVSVNTLRRYVDGVGPRKNFHTGPPLFCPCGCGRIVRKKGATSAHPGRKPKLGEAHIMTTAEASTAPLATPRHPGTFPGKQGSPAGR